MGIGAVGQQCPILEDQPSACDASQIPAYDTFWIWWGMCFTWCAIFFMVLAAVIISVYFRRELNSHYDYAASLTYWIDRMEWVMGERNVNLTARLATHEEETQEQLSFLEDLAESIGYGLMEFGGFVRNEVLTVSQRRHMFTQERANFLIWNTERMRAENTDVSRAQEEENEEEKTTDDEEAGPTEGMNTLMDAMRSEQSAALADGLWSDAAQIQGAIMTLLAASTGTTPRGMTAEVVTSISNVFQRLWRSARNHGRIQRADAYRRYVDDMFGVMNNG